MKHIILSTLVCSLFASPLAAQEVFPTPEAAAQALIAAAQKGEKGLLLRFFGPGSEPVFKSGDETTDAARLKQFNDAAALSNSLQVRNDTMRVLQIGRQQWTFPLPIVKTAKGWQFDLVAGKIEMRDREIGQNELSAIEACRTFAKAQAEYFAREPMGDDVAHYARKIVSTPGQRDGLYWPATSANDRSPLDGFLADAAIAAQQSGKPVPYRGYVFRVLTAQGKSAPGGAYSYLVNGRMLNGAALIAIPAEWGTTGVMSFICNQRGRIFERNLGAETQTRGNAIRAYDPGPEWKRVP